ncbi:MAG: membrane protein insertion efficiency factor YidD [Bdellovibrionales bacterium]|nr:membrane protein insertion efficiency factor YidD [Bdellovibrionales bacterium]
MIYRLILHPALSALGGLGQECRFEPSCSRYAEESFERFSFFRATKLTLRRLARCNPWIRAEAYDPIPLDAAESVSR